MLSNLILVGVMLGVVKFSVKASLGCGFSSLERRGILAVASAYLGIALAMSTSIAIMGEAVEGIINTALGSTPVFVVFQAIMAALLVSLGLYTIKKWTHDKRDITGKTSLLMMLPCPVCLLAIFMACSSLIIGGMGSIKVGLLVGGVFFASIMIISLAIRGFGLRKSPSSLGTVMISFALLYILSAVLVPAYLPVSEMSITVEGSSVSDVIPGSLFMVGTILVGFGIGKIRKWGLRLGRLTKVGGGM